MKLIRLAAPAVLGLALFGTAHAMPAAPLDVQPLVQSAQYGRWDGGPRFRGGPYGRPRVVCRVVRERRVNPYNGRVRIVEREVCRPRGGGPRW